MTNTDTDTIRADYEKLARAIGGGFHPDTRGADYTSLPDGYTAVDVDRIVEAAFDAHLDVYGIGLDVLNADQADADVRIVISGDWYYDDALGGYEHAFEVESFELSLFETTISVH